METILIDNQPEKRWAGIDRHLTSISWFVVVFMIGWISAATYYDVLHLWRNSDKLAHVEQTVTDLKASIPHGTSGKSEDSNNEGTP